MLTPASLDKLRRITFFLIPLLSLPVAMLIRPIINKQLNAPTSHQSGANEAKSSTNSAEMDSTTKLSLVTAYIIIATAHMLVFNHLQRANNLSRNDFEESPVDDGNPFPFYTYNRAFAAARTAQHSSLSV